MAEQETGQDKKRDERQFVVFGLDKETYGINISQVKEIINMQELTAVPKSAEYIKGIINLRGKVIPVFDLAGKFGLAAKPATKSTRIIVIEVRDLTVGIIVDAVSEVLRISSEVIEPPSGILVTDISEHFIEGIAKCADCLVIILNLDNALVAADFEIAV